MSDSISPGAPMRREVDRAAVVKTESSVDAGVHDREGRTTLVLVPKLPASKDSIYRNGSRWKRGRVREAGNSLFTVIAKLDLVALYLEAAGLETTGPKKGTR